MNHRSLVITILASSALLYSTNNYQNPNNSARYFQTESRQDYIHSTNKNSNTNPIPENKPKPIKYDFIAPQKKNLAQETLENLRDLPYPRR